MSGDRETENILAHGLNYHSISGGLAHAVLVESGGPELGADDARSLEVRAAVAPHLSDGAADEFGAVFRKSDMQAMRAFAGNVAEKSGTTPIEALAATLAITMSPDCVIDNFLDATLGADTPRNLVARRGPTPTSGSTLGFLSRRGTQDALVRLVSAAMIAWMFAEEGETGHGGEESQERHKRFCRSIEQAAANPKLYRNVAELVSQGAFGQATGMLGSERNDLALADAIAISLMPYPVCVKIAEAIFD